MLITRPFLYLEEIRNSVLIAFSSVSFPPSLSTILYFRLFMKFVDRLREVTVFRPFLLSSVFPSHCGTDRSLKYSLQITSYFFSKTPCYLSVFFPPFVFSTYKDSLLLRVLSINLRCHKKLDTDPLYVIQSR
jgi:hypothetical protein